MMIFSASISISVLLSVLLSISHARRKLILYMYVVAYNLILITFVLDFATASGNRALSDELRRSCDLSGQPRGPATFHSCQTGLAESRVVSENYGKTGNCWCGLAEH